MSCGALIIQEFGFLYKKKEKKKDTHYLAFSSEQFLLACPLQVPVNQQQIEVFVTHRDNFSFYCCTSQLHFDPDILPKASQKKKKNRLNSA